PPLQMPAARFGPLAAALRVRLACWPEVHFSGFPLSALRFYVDAEPAVAHTLYELLANNCRAILLRDPHEAGRRVELVSDALRPVGFDEDESILPYPLRSFTGYRLLQEYFAFPEKFFFFDLRGLDALRSAGFQNSAEIVFLIGPFERA